MKMNCSISYYSAIFLLIANLCSAQFSTSNTATHKSRNVQKIIFFNPEITPPVEEITDATYNAYFSTVYDQFSLYRNSNVLRVDSVMDFEENSNADIREFSENNEASFSVVSKIKFFKVGLGNYVFSSQVLVSLKLYDHEGNLLDEASYDTFKKNARILGSAENSIKIGTKGAIKSLIKKYKALKKS